MKKNVGSDEVAWCIEECLGRFGAAIRCAARAVSGSSGRARKDLNVRTVTGSGSEC